MNKVNRMFVGLILALLMLSMVIPTLTTVSADDYSSDGSNGAAQAAGYVVGGVAVLGVVTYLMAPKKANGISTPIGRTTH